VFPSQKQGLRIAWKETLWLSTLISFFSPWLESYVLKDTEILFKKGVF